MNATKKKVLNNSPRWKFSSSNKYFIDIKQWGLLPNDIFFLKLQSQDTRITYRVFLFLVQI